MNSAAIFMKRYALDSAMAFFTTYGLVIIFLAAMIWALAHFGFLTASITNHMLGASFLILVISIMLSIVSTFKKRFSWKIGAALCTISLFGFTSASILTLLGGNQGLSFGAIPILGIMYFQLDGLSSFFMLLISVVSIPITVYSLQYIREYQKKGYSIGTYWIFLSSFLLSMLAVVAAQNALLFLVFWEGMALASFFLVTYENRDENVKEAGFIYLLMAQLGVAMIIVMFFILGGISGSLDFSSFTGVAFTPFIATAIFILGFLGFASKAGAVPFHVWLPKAHPQAPSSISALMSGVMLNIAIYGMIRMTFGFLGASVQLEWWGLLLIATGILSAVFGVLQALLQHNFKKMLAYSSIENMGIIFIGIGASLIFVYLGNLPFAALALFAALYQSMNHAFFKSLLFMGAGNVLQSTHETEINKMGGLIKLMPATAMLFFIASYSISAVPPLNGFVSEWIAFQSLIGGASLGSPVQLIFVGAAVALALVSILALAAFVKVFGIVFLGSARSPEAKTAKEAPITMLAGMALLAIMCIVSGIFPIIMLRVAAPALSSVGLTDTSLTYLEVNTLPMAEIFIAVGAGLLAIIIVFWVFKKLFKSKHVVHDTWGCGFYKTTPNMQYTATGFSMPLIRVFSGLINPANPKDLHADFFERYIYKPIYRMYFEISSRSGFLQTGKVSHYLLYVLIALAAVLVYATH